jgi:hypothetical protein
MDGNVLDLTRVDMPETMTSRYTVGVFQDIEWATRGLEALRRHGFEPESLTIIARNTPEGADLVRRVLGREAVTLEVKTLGTALAVGSLVTVLQGHDAGLVNKGLAGTMRRVGFQPHDGFIFESLAARGGVLVAIENEPRAADALATLHAYGGGNAAIGAWVGRV